MHDDRAIEPDHFVGFRRAGGRGNIVVAADHVAPPCFFDVAFQLNAERAVVPKSIQAAVDFARLKNEASPFAQRDEFVHIHGGSNRKCGMGSVEWGISIHASRLATANRSGLQVELSGEVEAINTAQIRKIALHADFNKIKTAAGKMESLFDPRVRKLVWQTHVADSAPPHILSDSRL